jgi:hypothetical protein
MAAHPASGHTAETRAASREKDKNIVDRREETP